VTAVVYLFQLHPHYVSVYFPPPILPSTFVGSFLYSASLSVISVVHRKIPEDHRDVGDWVAKILALDIFS
jgi:hypothetical protein